MYDITLNYLLAGGVDTARIPNDNENYYIILVLN